MKSTAVTAIPRVVLHRHVEYLQNRLASLQDDLRARQQRELELWRRILELELAIRGRAS